MLWLMIPTQSHQIHFPDRTQEFKPALSVLHEQISYRDLVARIGSYHPFVWYIYQCRRARSSIHMSLMRIHLIPGILIVMLTVLEHFSRGDLVMRVSYIPHLTTSSEYLCFAYLSHRVFCLQHDETIPLVIGTLSSYGSCNKLHTFLHGSWFLLDE